MADTLCLSIKLTPIGGLVPVGSLTTDLPILQQPGTEFQRWLHVHGIHRDFTQLTALTRDIEFRRRFLMYNDLTPAQQQFVVDRVLPAYLRFIDSKYLCALAGLALSQYDYEQAFSLLYCFTRLSSQSLRNFLQRLPIISIHERS